MRRVLLLLLFLALFVAGVTFSLDLPRQVEAYVIFNFWPDGDNIVMDNVFLPTATWYNPSGFQLSEWNEVDTTDNTHPFLLAVNPVFSFSANNGRSTMGFLDEAGLNSVYGLSYASSISWTVCWSDATSGRLKECDMMLNSALPWQLVPDSNYYFQSEVLYQASFIRGLAAHNTPPLSMRNQNADMVVRGETLYMDDKEGVRQNATYVPEFDMVIYNKFHNGSTPAWMTVNPTTARVGETINFNNITVENRGTLNFGGLRFGTYLSTNDIISTGDQLLNTGSWSSYGRFTTSTFNWSAIVPSMSDCGTRYIGGIIDDNNAYAERYEGNNAIAFSNGTPDPQPFTVLLARDALEPNDTFATARAISLPFSNANVNIDQDQEQDFYSFTLTQLTRVNITVNFTHASGDVDLDLRNSNNAVLAASASVGDSETITRDLASGTYYIHVYGFSTGSCNRYTITTTTAAASALSINNVRQVEGNAGTTNFSFTVTLSPAGLGPVTVNYATANGTATAGSDYTATTGTLTFNSGETSKPVPVTVKGDTLVEGHETFVVNLSAPSGAAIGDGQGVGTITNDDLPSLRISDAAVEEGNSGTRALTFTVRLSTPSASPVTVKYATANGSATAPGDYTAVPLTTLMFTPGQTIKLVTVNVLGDTTKEPNETFVVNLSAPSGAIIADGQGIGTVINDDGPVLRITDVSKAEGNSGTTAYTFIVKLSVPSAGPVTVNYATLNGTATAGSDYTAASGPLTFSPGQTSKTVVVNVVGNTVIEPNETFVVNLSAASGATIADGQGSGIILNDDGSVLRINNVSKGEGNSGTSTYTFTVTLSPASASPVTVSYATVNGSAVAPSDYTAVPATVLTFTPGQTSKTVAVNVMGDPTREANEVFAVNLFNAVGATLFDSQGLGTILNDDGPVLRINNVSVPEGNVGSKNFVFAITLSPAASGPVSVRCVTANGTALAGSDYLAVNSVVTFTPGQTSRSCSVPVLGNTVKEPNETFVVNLSNAVGATLFDSQGLGTILNDEGPVVRINNVSVTEGNVGSKNLVFTVTLSPAAASPVSVRCVTANGTALAGSDYLAVNSVVTFTPGQTSRPCSVPVLGNTVVEANETFVVNLSNAVGATLFDSQGLGTILNDD